MQIALSIGVASGGLFVLYLAYRRQAHQEHVAADTKAHQERVADDTKADAAARQVTDLYTKAADQLGSDKAPVRLAGLYALERLAQNNPDQRQTIVNVLCAYLRMPYQLPVDRPADDTDERLAATYRERVQEREVRIAAQRILADHLRPGDKPDHTVSTFWADIDLDLAGATMVDFYLSRCIVRSARFGAATFSGRAYFRAATFKNATSWSVTFTEDADFRSVTFTEDISFRSVKFVKNANFGSAGFGKNANFESAIFSGRADFESATFTKANFAKTRFKQGVPGAVARFVPSRPSEEALPAPDQGTR